MKARGVKGRTSDTMKAAFIYEPLKLVIREDVKIPKPGRDEILVRVKAIGVCPSDVRYYTGEGIHREVPYGDDSYGLLGHEWSGEVVEVGPGVEGVNVGDYVAPDHQVTCNNCRYCRMGLTNLCINKRFYVRGFAEYALAYAPNAYKFPKHIKFEEACFAEPLSCVINSIRIADIKPGDVVLIVGAGPMGLLHTQLAKMSGATVIVSEILEHRINIAKQLGADVAVSNEADLSREVKELTEGIGVDKIIVTIGNRAAIEQHIKFVRKKGIIVLFGGTVPPTNISLDPNFIHYGEVILTGASDHIGEDYRVAMRLITERKISLEPLISHTFKLDELVEAFEAARGRKGLKVLVYP